MMDPSTFNFALAVTKHVWMAPVMEEKKKQRHPVHNLALATTRQAWVAPVMDERKKRGCPIRIPVLAATEQLSFWQQSSKHGWYR